MNSLNGKVAIVTGGSSGIGRATAIRLAKAGAHVVIVGRSEAHVREAVDMVQALVARATWPLGLVLDVGCEADMNEMVDQTIRRLGSIDILVNSAGVGKGRGSNKRLPYPVAQLPITEWDEMMRTNLKGTFLTNRAVLPTMMGNRSGIIINVASALGGTRGQPFAAAYCASKFGVLGLSESLAEEVGQYGIRVEVLFPDVTQTPLMENTPLEKHLGPLLPPERVAGLILYLVSMPDDAVLVTSRRLSHCIIRRNPEDFMQWDR
jgi:3-oxoacyl-[acyl-carrier protein] reductase